MEEQRVRLSISPFDPRVFVTVTLVVIHLSIMVAMWVGGGGFFDVSGAMLLRYGALARPLIEDDHQYWRLFAAMFLHANFLHFVMNNIALLFFGGRVEFMIGRPRYLALYLACGLTGNLASYLWGNAITFSVGSSGAIFGVVVMYMILLARGPVPWPVVARQRSSRMLFFLIGLMLVMGFLIPNIDSWAHLGGAATGALLGMFLAGPLVPAQKRFAALGIWIGAFVALCAFTLRSDSGPTRHIESGIFYREVMGRWPRFFEHFDSAYAEDPRRAVRALDRHIQSLILRFDFSAEERLQIAVGYLQLLAADKAALDYYGAEVEKNPRYRDLAIVAHLYKQPPVVDADAALGAIDRGRREFPGRYDWDLFRGRALAEFRRYDEALEWFHARQEGTTAPLLADHWEIAALCHLRRNEWEALDRATSRALNTAWLANAQGAGSMRILRLKEWRYKALRRLGRKDEASDLIEKIENAWRADYQKSPYDHFAANNLAWFLATHDRVLEEAAMLAQKSVERVAWVMNLDTLAWIEHLRGNSDVAWATMERALQNRRSKDPTIRYHAAEILRARGEPRRALTYAREAVDYGLDFDEYEAAQDLIGALKSALPGTTDTAEE